ncbi:MAG: cytochrome c oxidase accessory protein CcoG [Sediminibacterium sp. Gen4]|jgi:cytochrome c oxidase accessory protein FixG|uniref:cytochrome c oxidase accessory protein CcoG n=1 Tax=unclassified Sediminibacterium TaxID=2635961 RepID=UPI0015BA54FA|nr:MULTISPECIES: cytochrome c oxidase accessory protein CcoG [unclassified Sediminibacterium]MBW0161553.1 cytochrome c oxidase accessory protein CcoG [Sediminibacterium sp.]MBW0163927.1 cytochrome c oxidase accessory protein CcoG [Sediminibacterium sp.]NWK65852.1 cytochrome c oxidase accessory protein CcoG [Sediminibacterium sp. Gen4]
MSDVKHSNIIETEAFRDRIATVDESGKRKWIYAYQPKGKFYNIRTVLSVFYFLIFFGLPFIEIDGRPLFQFNIPEAKFIIFGKIFWPQDFFIFGLTMVTFVFFIVLFTAAFGRLFCGWACPQTNFMEMMFRRVEYWVLGDAPAQRQLKNAAWTGKKIFKVGLKHVLFFLLSFIIANFFLAYIIGIKELEKIIREPVTEHVAGFASIIVFSGVFYGVYAFFREQACTVVCPYGRLQSVLLDKNSMIVAYDYKRGESRGNFKKQAELNLGDCIDCHQCVKVCPTGIDIRNGVQMECVGCTACIDACNHIMDSIDKPRGLIRYASENSIAKGEPLRYTTRMKLYTGLCFLLLAVLSVILLTRKDVDATVIRTAGMLYQERGADSISNLYNIRMVNKTTQDLNIEIRLVDAQGRIQMAGNPIIKMAKEAQAAGTFFVVLPKENIKQRKTMIRLAIFENGKEIAITKTNFLGPAL